MVSIRSDVNDVWVSTAQLAASDSLDYLSIGRWAGGRGDEGRGDGGRGDGGRGRKMHRKARVYF